MYRQCIRITFDRFGRTRPKPLSNAPVPNGYRQAAARCTLAGPCTSPSGAVRYTLARNGIKPRPTRQVPFSIDSCYMLYSLATLVNTVRTASIRTVWRKSPSNPAVTSRYGQPWVTPYTVGHWTLPYVMAGLVHFDVKARPMRQAVHRSGTAVRPWVRGRLWIYVGPMVGTPAVPVRGCTSPSPVRPGGAHARYRCQRGVQRAHFRV